ncbi:MAG: hypothetical protein H6907_05465 [Hyphomicrobiales bacterium]|nr:hypothetical protein [Hyphomicrobiales bacterium]MCP5371164.1 hypothetical protein [Hyphomicrobiales bacterium]
MTENPTDGTGELLSRGLDGDLDRAEMRRLYRLAAADPAVPAGMGALTAGEEGLAALAAATDRAPSRDIAAAVAARLAAEAPRRRPWRRIWSWLRAPNGITLQPLSFAGGLAVAAAVLALVPALDRDPAAPAGRLDVSDLQFVSAEARVDWNYRFVLAPGRATRLALDSGRHLPVQLQFGTAEPVPVLLIHQQPDGERQPTHAFTVDGVGFATLRQPQPGDVVIIRNEGRAPVIVYAYTDAFDGARIDPATTL